MPLEIHGESYRTGGVPARFNDLPPIIHLILDEHIGLAGLPPEIPESSAAERMLRNTYRDFTLYRRAYSRFAQTELALASIFNHVRATEASKLVEAGTDGFKYRLRRNDWFQNLRGRGYAISVYQSSWLDLCSAVPVDLCDTTPHSSLNSMQRSLMPFRDRLRVLWLGLLNPRLQPRARALAAMETLNRFEADSSQAPRGVAYVLHLLLPHHDFTHRADCSVADSRTWTNIGDLAAMETNKPAQRRSRYGAYLNQVECTAHRIEALFTRLKLLGIYDEATILVHGDHGSRIALHRFLDLPIRSLTDRDVVDLYSTLLAIKTPSVASGVVQESIAVQDVLAEFILDRPSTWRPSRSDVVFIREPHGHFAAHPMVWPESSLSSR